MQDYTTKPIDGQIVPGREYVLIDVDAYEALGPV